jgi:cobalt-zinc-cadmium efflux system membrane fusion protein
VRDAKILLVDDDAVLSQVLRRVLARQGRKVVEAETVADAVRLAREQSPDLGLVDLCLPDGDGVELARQLAAEGRAPPLVLMTAYPLRLRDQPELAEGFARVLTKPLNLEELRQTVDDVLAEVPPKAAPAAPDAAAHEDLTAPVPEPAPEPTPPAAPVAEAAAPARPHRLLAWGGLAVVVLAAVVLLLAWQRPGMAALKGWLGRSEATPEKAEATPGRLLSDNTLELPPDTVDHLVIKAEPVSDRVKKRPLVLAGSLSFDPTRLYRVQARFAGEVIQLGEPKESHDLPERDAEGRTAPRTFRPGDHVRKGDLLAVVLSKDLGEKKSELVDALVTLAVDQENLNQMEKLWREGVTPEVLYRQQLALVAKDRNAAAKAELTLRTWQLSDPEIEEVKAEARRVASLKARRDIEKETRWAKVEVKAPADGVIVEMNVNLRNIVDTTFDLYKIADLSELGVLLNAYEEDLRRLEGLPRHYPWKITIPADFRGKPLDNDGIERIGYIVDPNQHTAPVHGRVHNFHPEAEETTGRPRRDRDEWALRVGQFITAAVELDAPPGVVSLPASALDEDGEDSVVFEQPDPGRPVFRMLRVVVTARTQDTVYVRSVLDEAQRKKGLRAIRPGDRIVTSGVVPLKATLEDLRSRQQEKKKPAAPQGK